MRTVLAPLLLAAPLLAAAAPADVDDAARVAWRYFERNTHAASGLVSSVDGYPSTTAWDTGSAILATVAAGELGLVSRDEAEARLGKLVGTLERMPLFEGALPNKAYHAATAQMTDYENRPQPSGTGFSAVDLGRLASALVLAGDLHPPLREAIVRALARWDTCRLARGGELYGVHPDASGRLAQLQEGRLGYEQYAAKALALLGVDTSRAQSYGRFLAEATVLGVRVPHDARDRRRWGAVDALVTEPWALDGLELGLAGGGEALARKVFLVQKRRYEEIGIPTALSEDHVDRAPWFVYDAILAGGAPWRTVGPAGEEVRGLRGLSTKAAFALAALFPDDPYAGVLRAAVAGARDPERGWFAGIYEGGGTNRALSANTNAVVLEAILFEREGPLHRACSGCEAWRAQVAALAGRRGACPAIDAGAAGPGGRRGADLVPAPAPDRAAAPGPRGGGRRWMRLNGWVGATYRGAEREGVGGLVTLWPWGSAFLRLGAEATPRSPHGETRLLWGLGWDDWRPGTFSLTVSNWGPLRPESAPGWRQAEANLGYKLPRLCSEWLCAAPVASVTVPFDGGPYADMRMTFTIARRWFVMAGVGRTIPGVFEGPAGTPDWRMVYGFGLWDWRPGSLFVTYHDWGPDWRARNGVLSVGVNWSF